MPVICKEAVAFLESIFGEEYTSDQIEKVLADCDGNVDRVINTFLEGDDVNDQEECEDQRVERARQFVTSEDLAHHDSHVNQTGIAKRTESKNSAPATAQQVVTLSQSSGKVVSRKSSVQAKAYPKKGSKRPKPSLLLGSVCEPDFPVEETGRKHPSEAPFSSRQRRASEESRQGESPTLPRENLPVPPHPVPDQGAGDEHEAACRDSLIPIATAYSIDEKAKKKWKVLVLGVIVILVLVIAGLTAGFVLKDSKKPSASSENAQQAGSSGQGRLYCSEWSVWSGCSATCGGGTQMRTRTIETQPGPQGTPCPTPSHLEDTQDCNSEPCPGDCLLTPWSPWSQCTKECGIESQSRTRLVLSEPDPGGASCPPDSDLQETRDCDIQPCPRGCEITEWATWSVCSKPCGGGEQSRTRTVVSEPEPDGDPCPHESDLEEVRACNTDCCPVNCSVSEWSHWTECSEDCGGGMQSRTRTIKVQSQCGGKPCPPESGLEEARDCNENCCPVDCEVSPWSAWGKCSEDCGGGMQSRTRTILAQEQCGGKSCPPDSDLKEARECNEHCCPVDCEVSPWSAWGKCSETCGGGTQGKTRSIEMNPQCGGDKCPELKRVQDCNTHCCPVDCRSKWTDWSNCGSDCHQCRTRVIERDAKCGGRECDDIGEEDCQACGNCTFPNITTNGGNGTRLLEDCWEDCESRCCPVEDVGALCDSDCWEDCSDFCDILVTSVDCWEDCEEVWGLGEDYTVLCEGDHDCWEYCSDICPAHPHYLSE